MPDSPTRKWRRLHLVFTALAVWFGALVVDGLFGALEKWQVILLTVIVFATTAAVAVL